MTDPLLRLRAQAQWEEIARKTQDLDRDLTPEAARAMLHELQVHQIELKMQNEELQQATLELEVTKARYFDLYELAPVGYLTVSEAGLILECNLSAANMLAAPRGGVEKKAFSNLIAKEDQDAWYLLRRKLAATHEQISTDIRIVRGDGKPLWFTVRAANVRDELGAMTTRVTLTDINERMLADQRLLESEARRKVATDSGRVAIWEVNIKTNRLIWDDNCFALYQIRQQDFNGSFDEWLRTIHPQDLDTVVQAYQNAVTGIRNYDLTFRIIWPDGSIRYMQARGEVLRESNGVADRMIGTNWDVTEQKLSQELLQTSVREKEALLKEVHHRVKNNLQVITSLLRLEAARSAVSETKSVLGSMKGRIRAMAQLHESLYRSGTFATIDLGVYLKQLATQVFNNQGEKKGLVRLTLDMGSVLVGMDQATVGGLLLNELVSNCAKHGFPGGRSGEVRVALQPLTSGPAAGLQWSLSVSDTGVGLPADFEERRKTSLGMQIVEDLSKQLGGTLAIDSAPDQGARFTVVFIVQEPTALLTNVSS